MCGIVGYIGENEACGLLLDGLRELEYRGYDSAGLALLEDDRITRFRAVGKLDNLVDRVGEYQSSGAVAAIGHTRWATHGKPTESNAHPHGLTHSQVVHNGIIENYLALRERVPSDFVSQTDTEVIVHLFEALLAEAEWRGYGTQGVSGHAGRRFTRACTTGCIACPSATCMATAFSSSVAISFTRWPWKAR